MTKVIKSIVRKFLTVKAPGANFDRRNFDNVYLGPETGIDET